jgi:phosphate transport system substrate-binding protein
VRGIRPAAIAAALAVALVAGACSSGTQPVTANNSGSPPGAGATSLTAGGSSFINPLMQRMTAEYKNSAGVTINYQSVGSSTGITNLQNGNFAFAASDAPLNASQAAAMPDAVHIPAVFGAVVVTFNLSGVTSLKLDGPTIANIYLGTIKNWNNAAIKNLNPGVNLPSTAITVVHRSDGSGTTFIFTTYLSKVSSDWASKHGAKTAPDVFPVGLGGAKNDGVTSTVKRISGAIGYVELAYAITNRLPVASVKNSTGAYVMPSVDSTNAATAQIGTLPADLRDLRAVDERGATTYPIVGLTWFIVRKAQANEAQGKAVVDFLWWAVHTGQRYTDALYYGKLPPSVAAQDEAAIKSITYNGTPLYTG